MMLQIRRRLRLESESFGLLRGEHGRLRYSSPRFSSPASLVETEGEAQKFSNLGESVCQNTGSGHLQPVDLSWGSVCRQRRRPNSRIGCLTRSSWLWCPSRMTHGRGRPVLYSDPGRRSVVGGRIERVAVYERSIRQPVLLQTPERRYASGLGTF